MRGKFVFVLHKGLNTQSLIHTGLNTQFFQKKGVNAQNPNILVARNNGDVEKKNPQLKLEQRLLPVLKSYCERDMPRLINVLRRSYKAVRDTELAQILKSEIKHEQNSVAFQTKKVGSLGDFTLDWDDPRFQDVVLRRKYGVGEEIAVSALLGSPVYEEEGLFSREGLMKVCITKPGLSSVLQFDCGVTGNGDGGSEFSIHNAYYLQSQSCLGASVYKGPLFSTLDPELQDELKEYLTTRGIVEDFTDFLLLHLHRRENSQYLNWLQKLEATISGDK